VSLRSDTFNQRTFISSPATTMSTYDPNADENWLKEYSVGQTTGGGWGLYGEIGNQEYRAKQEQQRKEKERRKRRAEEKQPRPVPEPPTEPVSPVRSAPQEKTWSTVFALLGFLAGAIALYDPADPSWGPSLFAGLVSGYITGRFYKALLLIGAVLLALQLYYGAK